MKTIKKLLHLIWKWLVVLISFFGSIVFFITGNYEALYFSVVSMFYSFWAEMQQDEIERLKHEINKNEMVFLYETN